MKLLQIDNCTYLNVDKISKIIKEGNGIRIFHEPIFQSTSKGWDISIENNEILLDDMWNLLEDCLETKIENTTIDEFINKIKNESFEI